MARIQNLFIVVIICLMVGPLVQADTLPNMYLHQVSETDEWKYSSHVYYKDGEAYMYHEETGDLVSIGLESFTTLLEMFNTDVLFENYEMLELKTTEILGRKAKHIQVVNSQTGLIVSESWIDEETGISLLSISYDEDGNEATRTTVLAIELQPDFSEIDFQRARTMNFLSYTRLTEEEFKEIAPWYDLNKQPGEDLPLAGLTLVADDNPELGILQVFYGDGLNMTTVQIHGKWDAINEISNATAFSNSTKSDYLITQGVGIRSTRTGVFISMLNEEEAAVREFLRSLVIEKAE